MEVSYDYDSLDRIEKIRYGNGVQVTYAYDCDGNISRLETKTDSAILLVFDYQYDGNGNQTAKTGIQRMTAGSSALDISYQYDVRDSCWRNGAMVHSSAIRMMEPETELRK